MDWDWLGEGGVFFLGAGGGEGEWGEEEEGEKERGWCERHLRWVSTLTDGCCRKWVLP